MQVLKTDKDKEEAKHEEEMAELMEKHAKELQDLGQSNSTVAHIISDMEKWPYSFSSTFQERQNMEFRLRPFFNVTNDILSY